MMYSVHRDLTKEGHIITGSFYQIYVVDVPVSVAGQVINPGGDWSMAIGGDAGASFEAAAIVDDSTFKYNAILDLPAYVTGEAINLNVQVTAGDQPISGAHVTAEFIHPTQSMGTLLSIMPTLIPPPDFVPEPNSPPGQAKLDVLQRDFNVADLLQPRSTTLDLYELDEGAYSSVPFMDTTVPGLYKVVVHISGNHPDVGPFHRTQTLCTMVLFDQVDRDASDLRVTEAEVIPGGMNLQLYIRPVDRFGNLLGPDYPDQIQVALSVGEVRGSPQDNVDGSYRIPLWIPEKTDPQIRIVIKGNTVYGGLLSKLDSSDAF